MLVVEVKHLNNLKKSVYVLIGNRVLAHTDGIKPDHQVLLFIFHT